MPLLGLGVYKLPDDVQAEAAVTSAISAGYRMIDTASVYKNEESVGRAITKCGVPRKDLFITSKIWNNAQRLGDVQGAFSRSLDRLKVSYVDLYLIHWPVPGCYLSTWKELESILESGRALSIGVSNFDIRHLEELRKIYRILEREYPEAYLETLVVLDGTTGQNALAQAKQFAEVANVNGIILTKLDGTAKGGIAVAIQSELDIPVKYIGVGETIDDLQKFDADAFVNALFDIDEKDLHTEE